MRAVMATAAKIVYPHIVKEPGYCGGKAAIDATRVRVNNVAWLAKQGLTPQQVLEHYSDLTLAQVHAALAYYYDNREEIEAELSEDERFFVEAEHQWDELVARHGGKPPENPTPEERMIPRPFPWTPKK
jgi:uncharacterized protein (DUF433 family)